MSASARRGVAVAAAAGLVLLALWFIAGNRDSDERSGAQDAPTTGSRPLVGVTARGDAGTIDSPVVAGLGASLSGRVVDPDGAPITGAQVCVGIASLSHSHGWQPQCVDADDGTFAFESLAAGHYRVSAAARGFIPPPTTDGAPGSRVTLFAGQRRDDLALRLRPGGAEVRGRLRDITGGHVSDALVWTESAATRSDDEGRFSLWVDVSSFVELEIDAEGYARERVSEHDAQGRELEILLRPEVILTGMVLAAETLAPLADLPVVATAPSLIGFSGSFATQPHVRTDSEGRFRFAGLAPGRYKPEVRAGSWRGQATEAVVLDIGAPPAEVELIAHPARRIAGRVVRADSDEGCPAATVTAYDAAGEVVDRGYADPSGEVAIGGLLPGPYELEVACAAHEPALAPIAVDLSEDNLEGERWEVKAPHGRAIRGRVIDPDGRGVAMAYVQGEAVPQPPDAVGLVRAVTDADGAFEARDLGPGSYRFYRIDAPGMPAPLEIPEVPLPADRDVDDLVIRLPRAGALEVHVVDPGGAPVAGAEVSIGLEGGMTRSYSPRDTGVWILDPTPPGTYKVRLSRAGVHGLPAPDDPSRAAPDDTVEIEAGRRATITLVTEPRDRSISGVVRARDGDLIADATVWAEAAESHVGWGGRVRRPTVARTASDIDGAFTLQNLEAGSYSIHARTTVGVEQVLDAIEAGRDDVVFSLPAGGSLAGRVDIRGGAPPTRFAISVKPLAGGRGRVEEFLHSAGEWRIVGLVPGPVTVEVQSAFGTANREVDVPEGGERDGITLDLAPRGTLRGRIVDVTTGDPVAGYWPTVTSANGRATAGSLDTGARLSGDDGRFALRGVPSGEVVLRLWPRDARRLGYRDRELRLVITPGGETDAGTIRVERRGSAPEPNADQPTDETAAETTSSHEGSR